MTSPPRRSPRPRLSTRPTAGPVPAPWTPPLRPVRPRPAASRPNPPALPVRPARCRRPPAVGLCMTTSPDDPGAVDLLEGFLSGEGFAPDPFQLESFAALDAGRNLLVSAPTGS